MKRVIKYINRFKPIHLNDKKGNPNPRIVLQVENEGINVKIDL